jgi:hypothetical protein
MPKRTDISSILVIGAGAIIIALSSCSLAETPEQCVERFAEQLPGELFDTGSWRSTLIYRLADDYKVPELQPGGVRNGLEGPSFTFAQGPEQAAFDNFSAQALPQRGAYLALNGTTFFRAHGAVGTMKDTLAAGCSGGPKGSRLVRINWAPERKETSS